jgi:hypothetical protein
MPEKRSANDHDNDGIDDGDASFEFEDGSAPSGRRGRWVIGAIRRAIPVLLMMALLVVVGAQPNLALLFHRPATDAPVPITVVCDVPWATIHLDGRGAPTRCKPGIAGTLPMARLSAPAGQHILLATADGFAPYPIYAVIHPQTPGLYLTQFTMSSSGVAQALAAANTYFASGYSQDVTFPATLWRALGLRQAPTNPALLVRDRFEAVSLDSYEPFYSETTYQRPIAPEPGAVGVAVVVVEHVTIYDGCGTTPLLERRMPVLYATRASVTFSARPNAGDWTATQPYALNPAAEITTTPTEAATPASPAGLLVLAARTELASQPEDTGRLSGELSAIPLVSATNWAGGLILSVRGGAGALWLYLAGKLTALSAPAQALTPDIPAIVPTTTLDTLRASLARQLTPICGEP